MGNRILLVDTAARPDATVRAQLAQCGFLVRVWGDVEAGAPLAGADGWPDLVLLRVDDEGAVELCRSLSAQSRAPVVVYCTRRDEDAVVAYLEAGAERALVGPLSRRELAARLGATLARRGGPVMSPSAAPPCQVGDLLIDLQAHLATKQGRLLSLTPTEFRLLAALARRAGHVVSHRELLREVWGSSAEKRADTLRLYVRYLRQKLGDTQERPHRLLSHRGVGYKLAEGAT